MRVIIIDNHDSFTYNLHQYVAEIDEAEVEVISVDDATLNDAGNADYIILSPGPGLPKEDDISCRIINEYYQRIPILGVCLGMQAIHISFGGTLLNLETVYHGIQSEIELLEVKNSILKNLSDNHIITVGRYHSWVLNPDDIHRDFVISSKSPEGHIMGIKHKKYPLEGVQFHPESYMTTQGKKMIRNFLDLKI